MNKSYAPSVLGLTIDCLPVALLALFLFLGYYNVNGQLKTTAPHLRKMPAMVDTFYVDQRMTSTSHLLPTSTFLQRVGGQGGVMSQQEQSFFESIRTAYIDITTVGPIPDAAYSALQFAADIWSTEIVSSIPITIEVAFVPLPSNTIASAVINGFAGVPNAPDPNAVYNTALAEAIAGIEVAPGEPDFLIYFNSSMDFYYGTDANPPTDQIDFVTTTLHEMGHGIGMVGSVNDSGTEIGFANGVFTRLYDRFVELGDGTPILSLGAGSEAQAAALRSNDLFMNAPSAVAALGTRPKLFAPENFDDGSSYSHWDEETFPAGDPNALMTNLLIPGESAHDIGDIFRGLLQDIGWNLTATEAQVDGAIIGLDAPRSGKGLTDQELVTISIGNSGSSPIGNFPVAYQLDNNPFVIENFDGSIAPGEIAQYTFQTPVDLSEAGRQYTINYGISIPGDENAGNNETRSFLTHPSTISTLPYFEDFESGAGDWMPSPLSSWELGTPAGTLINAAANGTQAWATNLNGNYESSEASVLLSPCFDFGAFAADPFLSFALHTETEEAFDGMSLQVSTDEGVTWQNVGQLGDDSWYDLNLKSFGSGALDYTGGNGDSFSGSSGGYRQVGNFLDGMAGEPSVMVRFAFGSDGTVTEEGVAIDLIGIAVPETNGTLEAILLPETGVGFGTEETVTVTVSNGGLSTIENLQLQLQINDQPVATEDFQVQLISGGRQNITFQNTVDLSVAGSYEVNVQLVVDGDQVPTDNENSQTVASLAVASSNFPFAESFETGPSGWFTLGTNSSWELGVPSGTSINGTTDGANAWATNLNGPHNTQEQSFVLSPVFDFTSLSQPKVSLDIFHDLGFFTADPPDFPNDVALNGAALQYSTDLGETWKNVGTLGDQGEPNNWYNANITNDELGLAFAALSFSGGNGESWSFQSPGYVTATQAIPELAGASQVQFRLVLGTIGFDIFDTEGVAFDNFRIYDQLQIQCPEITPLANEDGTCSAVVTIPTPTVTGSDDFVIVNDYNGTDNASGAYPVGTTLVTWTASDASTNQVVTCTVEVTVNDVEIPTLAAEDVIVTALPGATEAIVDYPLPVFSDNCPAETVLSHSNNLGMPFDAFTLSCPFGRTSFIRVFQLNEEFNLAGDFVATQGVFGVMNAFDPSGSQEVQLNLYALPADAPLLFEEFIPLTSQIVEVPNVNIADPSQHQLFRVPLQATIPEGHFAVMEILTGELRATVGNRDLGVASNFSGQTAPSYLAATAPECGALEPIPISEAQGFESLNWVMGLVSDITPELRLVSGRGPGASFPLGISEEVYEVSDASGNVASVAFNVVVEEPPFDINLVQAPSGATIQELVDGLTLDIFDPNYQHVSIVADLDDLDESFESVVFELNGEVEKIENLNPYAIAGDSRGSIRPFRLPVGDNVLTVTPYTRNGGKGQALESVTVAFSVINGSAVSSFQLVDADTDRPIGPLGPVIDLAVTPNVSIEAITEPAQVGSVVLQLNDLHPRTENLVPYSLGSDRRGDFRSVAFQGGPQTLTATPYELKGGRGSVGAPLTADFEVIYGAVIERLEIVNTTTNHVLGDLMSGATIDLANPDMSSISLVAVTGPAEVGSVSFELDGELVRTENFFPYAIAGDRRRGTRLNPFDFGPGMHTLVVSTFSKSGRQGIAGGAVTINFEVTFGATIDQLNIVSVSDGSVISALGNPIIDLQDPVYEDITVIAETMPTKVGSVVFYLDGNRIKTENFAPYAIAGDRNKGRRLFSKRFEVGEHELTVVPYSKAWGKGLEGQSKTVNFTVIDEVTQNAASRVASVEETSEENVANQSLVVFPVPFNTSMQFALDAELREALQIELIDLGGRTLISKSYEVASGANLLHLDLEHMYIPKGTYLVRITGEHFGVRVVKVAKD